MRTTSLLAFFALLLHTSTAQECVVQQFPHESLGHVWSSLDVLADGGVVGTVKMTERPGDLLVQRVDASGAVVWKVLVDPTNPIVELRDPRTTALHDDGTLIQGNMHFKHAPGMKMAQFVNHYMVRLDPAGQVLWARFYMHEHSVVDWRALSIVARPLQNGDLLLATASATGVHVSRLDGNGIPLWSKRYGAALVGNTTPKVMSVAISQDERIVVGGELGELPFMLQLDGAGALNWAHRFEQLGYISALTWTEDGDVLAGGYATDGWPGPGYGGFLLRSDGAGVPQWSRWTGYSPIDLVQELPSAELFVGRRELSYQSVTALRTNAMGEAIAAWHLQIPVLFQNMQVMWPQRFTMNDLVLGMSGNERSMVMRADGFADLSCALATQPLSTSLFTMPPATPFNEGSSDVIKSWPMALGGPLVVDAVDMLAGVTTTCSRPGFVTGVFVSATNTGGAPNGQSTIQLTVDPQFTFDYAVPPPHSVNGNILTWQGQAGSPWNIPGLFRAYFTLSPSAPLGTLLTSSVTVTQDSVELTLANNTATWTQEVTGSYDPNDKLVRPEGLYHFQNDSLLDYTIRFQNTGTDTAFTVVIADTLAASLDVSTFKPGAASHPYTYTLTGGGLLTFTFANILLPDSNVNEPRSHGLVKFSIKPHAPIEMGQAFVNRAYIYFDFNEPIITPDAVTVVGLPMRVAEVERAEQPHLYPVPAKQAVTVVLPQGARAVQAWQLSPDGRRSAVTADFQGDRTVVSVAHLAAGVHFLQLVDRSGRVHVARFVKE